MRDKKFVAVHRGGTLTLAHHRQLIKWARECSEHVLVLHTGPLDERLTHALAIARSWENGKASTGDAIKASLAAHAVAKEASDPVLVALARSIGQSVATAHMADHALGGALYALKAISNAGHLTDTERAWQNEKMKKLPEELIPLLTQTMLEKGKTLKIL